MKIRVVNIGCVGGTGLEVALDDVVCLVGANNSGKTTVLRAYELAATNAPMREDDFNRDAGGVPAIVELWVHIPEGTPNIADDWVEVTEDSRLVRSQWTWGCAGKPIRRTWNPTEGKYAEDGKAAGLDQVFQSRLPQPLRIGSLQEPSGEHELFLNLLVDPIAASIESELKAEGSELGNLLAQFVVKARAPIDEANEEFERIKNEVNKSFQEVFPSMSVHLRMGIAPPEFNAKKALAKASEFYLKEFEAVSKWTQQGTGAQRALFWSMLQVRSKIKAASDAKIKQNVEYQKKLKSARDTLAKAQKGAKEAKTESTRDKHAKVAKEYEAILKRLEKAGPGGIETIDDPVGLPGHMLLIDEPETALHPAASRAASAHLYELATDDGWQVMMATHSPAFINPLQDHTTIVRLARTESNPSPRIYRADRIHFSEEEVENLKQMLRFDSDLAEMFFGARPILVEGDTEYAAFQEVLERRPDLFPRGQRPILVRARGKDILRPLIRILTHFQVAFSVLHDSDVFQTSKGTKNSAWSANERVYVELIKAQESGLVINHSVSIPNFEGAHGGDWEEAGSKPFEFLKRMRGDPVVAEGVEGVLRGLLESGAKLPDAVTYLAKLRADVIAWGSAYAPGALRFAPLEEQ